MDTIIIIFIFIFGLCCGSFFNVLIDRLPNGKNPFQGRSHCDHCKKTLSPFDLIPLVSFLLLKGKCRYCKKKLSWQYPFIELVTGLLFIFTFIYLLQTTNYKLLTTNYISLLIVFSSFLVIFVSDFKYQIIPDEMLMVAICGILLSFVVGHILLVEHVSTAILTSVFFLIIFLITKGQGMGFGDVKLALVLGLWLGFPKIVVGLYLAFLTGAAVSLILILFRNKNIKSQIAFGPFLIFGSTTSFFIGEKISQWYFAFFH